MSPAADRPVARLPAAGSPRAGRSRCSSTTGPSRARSPSSGCSTTASASLDRLVRRLRRRAATSPAHPHRHRRRVLRPPPRPRRHGAGLRARSTRARPGRPSSPTTASSCELHPPDVGGRDHENSSWSCAHGVERWRSDCGCNSGGRLAPGAGAAPLREALDWLRDAARAAASRRAAGACFPDPWAARDAYIDVILDRTAASVRRASSRGHAPARSTRREQRPRRCSCWRCSATRMLMYTAAAGSSTRSRGIETVQVLAVRRPRHPAGEELFGGDLEAPFLRPAGAGAEQPPRARRRARQIYEKFVKPGDGRLAAGRAHYAVSSLFETYPQRAALLLHGRPRDGPALRGGQGEAGWSGARASRRELTGESAELELRRCCTSATTTSPAGCASYHGDRRPTGDRRRDARDAFSPARSPRGDPRLDSTSRAHLLAEDRCSATSSADPRHRPRVDAGGGRGGVPPALRASGAADALPRDLRVPLPRAFRRQRSSSPIPTSGAALAAVTLTAARASRSWRMPRRGGWRSTRRGCRICSDGARSGGRAVEGGAGRPGSLIALRAVVDVAQLLPFGVGFWHAQNRLLRSLAGAVPQFFARRGTATSRRRSG